MSGYLITFIVAKRVLHTGMSVLVWEVHKNARSPEHSVHEFSQVFLEGLAALVVRIHVVSKVQKDSLKFIVVHSDGLLFQLECLNFM